MARPSVLAAALVLLAMMLMAGAVPDVVHSTEAAGQDLELVGEDAGDASLEQIKQEVFGEAIRGGDTEMAIRGGNSLQMAKKACQAGWLETKKQCNLVTASTTQTMALLKIQIKAAGAEIGKEVLATIETSSSSNSTSGNLTAVEYRALRLRVTKMTEAFERLGETVDMVTHNVDETAMKKTLAHMACQVMWQEVEALCTKADQKADDGVAAVTEAIKTSSSTFEQRGITVADKSDAPSMPPNMTKARSRLGESTGDNKEGTVFLEDMLTEEPDSDLANLDVTQLNEPIN